jgi:hypothetical protein
MSTWEDAAEQLGIRHHRGPITQFEELRGHIDGWPVLVRHLSGEDQSSTRYVVRLKERIPVDVVRPRPIRWSWRWSLFRSADPKWDRRFVVKTKNLGAAEEFLTSERRDIFDRIDLNFENGWRLRQQGLEVSRPGYSPGTDVVKIARSLVRYANGITTGEIPTE